MSQKTEEKVFNWSEVHLSEVISYKIHTLVFRFDIDEKNHEKNEAYFLFAIGKCFLFVNMIF